MRPPKSPLRTIAPPRSASANRPWSPPRPGLEVLWAHAVPLAENHRTAGPEIQVTAVQRDIARLLTEGHVDDVVARRMGISVRTCRSHIARLAQSLGATSRTHLGALLVESGIVEAPDAKRLSPRGAG
ncbi:hypothetical protein SCALM49S_01211 [Streptomyces californicus]